MDAFPDVETYVMVREGKRGARGVQREKAPGLEQRGAQPRLHEELRPVVCSTVQGLRCRESDRGQDNCRGKRLTSQATNGELRPVVCTAVQSHSQLPNLSTYGYSLLRGLA